MRVSILNLNLVGPDAIGQAIINQSRFFLRRGDEVRIFVSHLPEQIPESVAGIVQSAELGSLIGRREPHFARSDLYIYHYPGHYPLVESIRGIDRGRVVFFYHNVTPSALWGGSEAERLHLDNSRFHLPSLLPYADLIVTPSQYNAEELVAEFGADPERLRVLPLAVPLNAFAPRPADPALLARFGLSNERLLLFVGRMAGNKRIDLLVEALHALRDRYPELHLLLAGDDRSNEGIRCVVEESRARAAACGIADRVHFTGPVDEVAPLFNLATLYVTASLHEGFGVPLIEAMASGVPVIASDVAAHPSVLDDAGLLVPPKQPGAMADAIARLLDDDALYGEMVRRGRARAASYSVERFNQGWGGIVADLVEGMPPSLPSPAEPAPLPSPPSDPLSPPPNDPPPVRQRDPLFPLIDHLSHSSDTMHRGYEVRSGAPVVGPLIGWVRRNLTSHLREPYIDPTFERQALFNQHVTHALRLLAERSAPPSAMDGPLARVKQLSQRLREQVGEDATVRATLDELDAEIAALWGALKNSPPDEG